MSLSKYIAHPGASGQDEGAMALCGPTDHSGGGCEAPQRDLELVSQDLWRKTLFVFSAMWLGEGVFQSEVRFMLGFTEMGYTVLEVVVVPWDNNIPIIHQHLVWTSVKPWSLQELSAAISSVVCKTLFPNVTQIIVPAVMCFLRIHLAPGTW